jgi:hypothetical protein
MKLLPSINEKNPIRPIFVILFIESILFLNYWSYFLDYRHYVHITKRYNYGRYAQYIDSPDFLLASLLSLTLGLFFWRALNYKRSFYLKYTSIFSILFFCAPTITQVSVLHIENIYFYSFIILMSIWLTFEIANIFLILTGVPKNRAKNIQYKKVNYKSMLLLGLIILLTVQILGSYFGESEFFQFFNVADHRAEIVKKLNPILYFLINILGILIIPTLSVLACQVQRYKYVVISIFILDGFLLFFHFSHRIFFFIPIFLMVLFFRIEYLHQHWIKTWSSGLIIILLLNNYSKYLLNDPLIYFYFDSITAISLWRIVFAYPFMAVSFLDLYFLDILTNISTAGGDYGRYVYNSSHMWASASFIPTALIKGGVLRLLLDINILAFIIYFISLVENATGKVISFAVWIFPAYFIISASYLQSALLSNGIIFMSLGWMIVAIVAVFITGRLKKMKTVEVQDYF